MRSEQAKSARSSHDALKKRSSTSAPIRLEDLMDKEVLSSSQDGTIRELLVLSDPSNEQSTKIKQKIRMLDHPKNLIKVLQARLSNREGSDWQRHYHRPKQVPFHQDLPRRGSQEKV